MEANLNQFRTLLTVHGEREANNRRGAGSLRTKSFEGSGRARGRSSPAAGSGGGGQHLSVSQNRDKRMSSELEESMASGNSSPVRMSYLTQTEQGVLLQPVSGNDGSTETSTNHGG